MPHLCIVYQIMKSVNNNYHCTYSYIALLSLSNRITLYVLPSLASILSSSIFPFVFHRILYHFRLTTPHLSIHVISPHLPNVYNPCPSSVLSNHPSHLIHAPPPPYTHTATLKKNEWIDPYTRAVFLEFAIYNANVNKFSLLILLVEFPEIG